MAILDFIAIILAVVSAVVLVPVVTLFLEICAGVFLGRSEQDADNGVAPRFAVLVPAHDEALVIGDTIKSIIPQLKASDRLLVVADNCSDRTAEIAQSLGAEVVRRVDPERRGKGFALDYGVEALRNDPPETVVVVDADCHVGDEALARIARAACAQNRPIQAQYEMLVPPERETRSLKVAAFAWRVKNGLRPRGLHAMGLPCQLMGTGMAFPWHVIADADLATLNIVEDLVLGLKLAEAGAAPHYAPHATVTSWFPATDEGQSTQRTRWETGHFDVIWRVVPRMVLNAIRTRDKDAFILAMDAAVPPVAFLALVLLGLFSATSAFVVFVTPAVHFWIAATALVTFASSVLLAWWNVGRDLVSVRELCLAPLYMLSKLALYGRIIIGRRVSWVRSRRDRR